MIKQYFMFQLWEEVNWPQPLNDYLILNHSGFSIFCWCNLFDIKFTVINQKCKVLFNSDRCSFTHSLIFSCWMILIITHSGHCKNYSSKLIMILDTHENMFQTPKITICMLGVRNDQKHSLIIWSQSTPKFEILRILNNGYHWNALFSKVSPLYVWR